MVSCILIPFFSRETPCQKVIKGKQVQRVAHRLPRGVAAWRPTWSKQNTRLLDMCMDQCYGRVLSVRSKSNVLLAYVSNFLIVIFILRNSFIFCGEMGKECV